ncbi:xylose isomerase [Aliidongia dinghuensis]|uniref:Xylose isomerase n=1 Tax=Aliidongia dinghuensis TaxID=1867774 RepID=A0A8J2YYP6_9PROT|nr:xylose isomerase [Aliidongia dinghuensis]
MIPLGVAHLTALELPPPAFVRAATKAGFRSVGLRLHPAMAGGAAYPTQTGTKAHSELRDLLRAEGVTLHDIEFIQLTPEIVVDSFAAMLEAGADLGAVAVTVSGDDKVTGRLTENFAAMCDLAASFGLRVDLEFMRWRAIGTLAQAASIVVDAGKPNGAVLVDALHLSRSGGTPADLRNLPAGLVRAAQLCDAGAVLPTTDEDTILEARGGRLPPGDGALPLVALLDSLPPDTALGAEVPLPALDADTRLARVYAGMRNVLAATDRSARPASITITNFPEDS